MSAPKNILIVRLGAMGDIIHAMPAVAALRKASPESIIGWVVEKRWSELLTAHLSSRSGPDRPLVDWVHVVDTRRWRKSLLSGATRNEIRGALKEVRETAYQLAIDFQGAIKSAVVAKLSVGRARFGFSDSWEPGASMLYTNRVATNSIHVIEQNFDLAEEVARAELGCALDRATCAQLPQNSDAEMEVTRRLALYGLHERFAILNPGAGWGAKQWPVEGYIETARTLGEGGVRSLVNYGPGEEELAKTIERESEGHAIAAQFTISQLIAVTRNASLFIGGDTGPLHLAAALKVPVVALFGPTDPARTGPYGTRSMVLRDPSSVTSHKRNRETEAGLKNISAEQVIAAARQLLEGGRRA